MTKKQLQSKIDELKIEISLLQKDFYSREKTIERYQESAIEDQKMYQNTIIDLKEENETLKKMLL